MTAATSSGRARARARSSARSPRARGRDRRDLELGLQQWGVDRAGADGVHAHAVRRGLGRERAGHREDADLRGLRRHSPPGPSPRARTRCSRSRRAPREHRPSGRARTLNEPVRFVCSRPCQSSFGRLGERGHQRGPALFTTAASGPSSRRRPEGRGDGGGIADVAATPIAAAPAARDAVDGDVERRAREGDEHDGRSRPGERGGREANARARARDEGPRPRGSRP